ncbi:ATP-binding domain-containing protein, partial [Methylacidiphilum caldifontis]|uniref:ATP-binding domain-containing protein n=1 Tax=Methylacidiphilum caldifontis TaxID=2795386 RepID=UPI00141BCB72
GASFRLGDRVTQTRNRYDKGVFNGDIGWVDRFGPPDRPNANILGTAPNEETDEDEAASTGVWVHFGADPVWYSAEEAATDLRLAYATTVHKSQGAEYPIVILPVFYDAYMMLYRNLIYTALTRAKRHAVIMVEAQALWLALKRGDSATRQTHLTEYLQNPPSLR